MRPELLAPDVVGSFIGFSRSCALRIAYLKICISPQPDRLRIPDLPGRF
jgi:hypothetical protein